jgi:nucleoid DNA-binding protein
MAKKGGAPTKSEIRRQFPKTPSFPASRSNEAFDSLQELIRKQLTGRGPGEFVIPGLVKLRVVKKPATKAREGVNPFTGEKMMFKAKPASRKVRALPLKSLKSMVN